MKKRITKFTVLIAAVLMIAMVFAACGSSGGGAKSNDMTGKYTAQVDMKDALNKGMESSGITVDKPLIANIYLELKGDQTFALEINADEFLGTIKDYMKENGKDIITKLMEAQGLSEDMLDTALSAAGYDSIDGMVDELVAQIDNSMTDEMKSQLSASGKYAIDGSKITFTPDKDALGISEGTIGSDGSITVKGDAGDMGELEMVFKK